MKHISNYIIPLILVVVALISGVEKSDSYESEHQISCFQAHKVSLLCHPDNYTSELDVLLPCHISFANILRENNTSYRHFTHVRISFGALKLVKFVDIYARDYFQQKSLLLFLPFIRHAHRLISLGKLII